MMTDVLFRCVGRILLSLFCMWLTVDVQEFQFDMTQRSNEMILVSLCKSCSDCQLHAYRFVSRRLGLQSGHDGEPCGRPGRGCCA